METPIKPNIRVTRAEQPNGNEGLRSPQATMEHNIEEGRYSSARIGK